MELDQAVLQEAHGAFELADAAILLHERALQLHGQACRPTDRFLERADGLLERPDLLRLLGYLALRLVLIPFHEDGRSRQTVGGHSRRFTGPCHRRVPSLAESRYERIFPQRTPWEQSHERAVRVCRSHRGSRRGEHPTKEVPQHLDDPAAYLRAHRDVLPDLDLERAAAVRLR